MKRQIRIFGTILRNKFFPHFILKQIKRTMENIETGLLLMLVGMTTTFIILLIIIWLSNLLIAVVNRIAPEEAPKKKVATAANTNADAMDAIKAAVNILTAGKGQVIKVEKL